jgi:poly(3-hydroxybutyrate) depolymerase
VAGIQFKGDENDSKISPQQEGETAESSAEYYATTWMDFAKKRGFILLAPTFNQEDFSSRRGDHALSGYRGLFGRQIGADEWVLRLVRAHQEAFGSANGRFYLYGHSAGGQFSGRFLVTHPESVKAAVISSAATYPQPNAEVAWPFGMGELHTDVEWDPDTVLHLDIVPDRQKWLAATSPPHCDRWAERHSRTADISCSWTKGEKSVRCSSKLDTGYGRLSQSSRPGKPFQIGDSTWHRS